MTAVDPITGASREQLAELAKPFPDALIEGKDGQSYVAHHIITQRLLSVVGPFDFELVREIRSDVPGQVPDPNGRSRRAKAGTPTLHGAVTGVVGRLTVEIDGRRVTVEEAGDVGDVHNWPHDGARLKDAASDALKRCAMRVGLALHLWSQEHYFLDAQLSAAAPQQESAAPKESKPGGANAPENASPDARPTAEPAKAPDPSQGRLADGTPPGFDHIRTAASGAVIRSWIKGHPDAQLRERVYRAAAEAGVKVSEASPDDLRTLIEVAWKTHQAA